MVMTALPAAAAAGAAARSSRAWLRDLKSFAFFRSNFGESRRGHHTGSSGGGKSAFWRSSGAIKDECLRKQFLKSRGSSNSKLDEVISIIDEADLKLTAGDIEELNRHLSRRLSSFDGGDALAYVKPGEENSLMVFSCSGHPQLALEVCANLRVPVAHMWSSSFADGETKINVRDDVRSKDVYVIQSFNADKIHDQLMELFFAVSCLRRASAERITAILPYVPYSRVPENEALPAVFTADISRILHSMGADRVLFIDHHDARATAYFPESIPVTNLIPHRLAVRYLRSRGVTDPVIVSPGNHGGARAKAFWARYQTPEGPTAGMAALSSYDDEVSRFVGDVKGKDVVIVDDIIDSGDRVLAAANSCSLHGARRIFAYAPHCLFREGTLKRIDESPIHELIVMDTMARTAESAHSSKLKVLQISRLLSLVIKRLNDEISASGPREPLAELYSSASEGLSPSQQ